MNPGGVVLILAGVWAGTQLLAGGALERLRLTDSTGAATTGTPATSTSSDPGPTRTPPTSPQGLAAAGASGYVKPTYPRLGLAQPL